MDLNASLPSPEALVSPATRPVKTKIKSFKELDAQAELLEQYTTAKRLLSDAEYDEQTPLNQKAQALNTISNILGNIVKNRTELYNSERLRLLEATLLEVLQEFPTLAEKFMPVYEARLKLKEED